MLQELLAGGERFRRQHCQQYAGLDVEHQAPGSSRNARMLCTPLVGCSGNEPRRTAIWGSRSRTLQRGTRLAMALPRRVIHHRLPSLHRIQNTRELGFGLCHRHLHYAR